MRAFVDGNKVGLVNDDFKNLQESDVVWVERCDMPSSYEPIIDELRFIKSLCGHEEKVKSILEDVPKHDVCPNCGEHLGVFEEDHCICTLCEAEWEADKDVH